MARFRIAVVSAVCTALFLLVLGSVVSQPTSLSAQETVTLARGSTIALATPAFIEKGKRYAFTWPGGGPPQTFTVKDVRPDGWIIVEVAEENLDPNFLPYGTVPLRWLHVGIATSVQEMRPLPHQ
jgi:hypothetical protein